MEKLPIAVGRLVACALSPFGTARDAVEGGMGIGMADIVPGPVLCCPRIGEDGWYGLRPASREQSRASESHICGKDSYERRWAIFRVMSLSEEKIFAVEYKNWTK